MNYSENRNPFAEFAHSAICNISSLMQTDEVARDSKALLKINRFKVYLTDLMAKHDSEPKQGVIDFTETPNPEDNSNY